VQKVLARDQGFIIILPMIRFFTALLSVASALVSAPGLTADLYVPFPSEESLKELQLITIACARDNTPESCAKSRELADPLMDHPRLPASCKDLIWSIVQNAKPAARNSYQRREVLSDPAQRMLLVCRSMELTKPEAQQPQAPDSQKKSGFGFGGS
jgi:hypothetical protein